MLIAYTDMMLMELLFQYGVWVTEAHGRNACAGGGGPTEPTSESTTLHFPYVPSVEVYPVWRCTGVEVYPVWRCTRCGGVPGVEVYPV